MVIRSVLRSSVSWFARPVLHWLRVLPFVLGSMWWSFVLGDLWRSFVLGALMAVVRVGCPVVVVLLFGLSSVCLFWVLVACYHKEPEKLWAQDCIRAV